MDNVKRPSRSVLTGLLVSALLLGTAPASSAQQLASARTASSAETTKSPARQSDGQKKLAEGEPAPLKDEEMERVEGEGWGIAIGVAGLIMAGAQIWQSNHAAHGHPSEINIRTKQIIPGLHVMYPQFRHNVPQRR